MPATGYFRSTEITDEAAIDVTDGSIEDWEELFGEPSLTSLDFTGFTSYQGSGESMDYNPSDLDFRIWLGWNGASDRIYVGRYLHRRRVHR